MRVQNVWRLGVSLAIGEAGSSGGIVLDGEPVAIDDLDGVVVGGLVAAGGLMDVGSDAAYAEEEFAATWLALLASARCRVVNRAATQSPLGVHDAILTRTIARGIGVPTLHEIIRAPGSDAASGPAPSGAYTDLADRSSLFGGGALDATRRARHYSICLLADTAPCVCCIRAGERFISARVEEDRLVEADEDRELASASALLLDHLSLEYAYCVYYATRSGPKFARAYTWPPLPMEPALTVEAARALTRHLER